MILVQWRARMEKHQVRDLPPPPHLRPAREWWRVIWRSGWERRSRTDRTSHRKWVVIWIPRSKAPILDPMMIGLVREVPPMVLTVGAAAAGPAREALTFSKTRTEGMVTIGKRSQMRYQPSTAKTVKPPPSRWIPQGPRLPMSPYVLLQVGPRRSQSLCGAHPERGGPTMLSVLRACPVYWNREALLQAWGGFAERLVRRAYCLCLCLAPFAARTLIWLIRASAHVLVDSASAYFVTRGFSRRMGGALGAGNSMITYRVGRLMLMQQCLYYRCNCSDPVAWMLDTKTWGIWFSIVVVLVGLLCGMCTISILELQKFLVLGKKKRLNICIGFEALWSGLLVTCVC